LDIETLRGRLKKEKPDMSGDSMRSTAWDLALGEGLMELRGKMSDLVAADIQAVQRGVQEWYEDAIRQISRNGKRKQDVRNRTEDFASMRNALQIIMDELPAEQFVSQAPAA
jgi:hypothetical protein